MRRVVLTAVHGARRLVVRMRCESGKDGSPVPLRLSVALRIRA